MFTLCLYFALTFEWPETDTIVSSPERYFTFMLLSLCGYVLFVVIYINVCLRFMFVLLRCLVTYAKCV